METGGEERISASGRKGEEEMERGSGEGWVTHDTVMGTAG